MPITPIPTLDMAKETPFLYRFLFLSVGKMAGTIRRPMEHIPPGDPPRWVGLIPFGGIGSRKSRIHKGGYGSLKRME